jgi:hypothetical protein
MKRPKIYSYTDEDWIEYADALEGKIAALERRARIAWRIIGKLVNVNSGTSHELFHEAEREIDAELAKELLK